MKKIFSIAIAIIAIVSFSACKKTEKPESVAEKFLNHLNKMEIDEAKKYATAESAGTLDLLKSFVGANKPQGEVKPVVIKGAKEDGDKATVTYQGNDGSPDQTIDLVKVEGQWKVSFKKETPAAGGEMNEAPADSTATTAADTTAKAE